MKPALEQAFVRFKCMGRRRPKTDIFFVSENFFQKVVNLSRQRPFGINGGIILMHLGTQRRRPQEQVHFILGKLIDTLRTDGYRFVTVSELVTSSGISLASLRERIHIQ